jgi:hypothetical protein
MGPFIRAYRTRLRRFDLYSNGQVILSDTDEGSEIDLSTITAG